MPRIEYETWAPGADAKSVIRQANTICADYRDQGYDLTLRQLYYQFVARGLIPNTDRSYKRLGSIVNKARMAGMMDWNYIVDRTRNLESLSHWDKPADIIEAAAQSFRTDVWRDQPTRIEVWVEKEALAGVVGQAAERADVSYFSCRGYVSQSELWGAGRRLGSYIKAGQNIVVLHLGDHDPSGIDMTRDITDRLETFITQDWLNAHGAEMEEAGYGMAGAETPNVYSVSEIWEHMSETNLGGRTPLVVDRIALNMDQVDEYNPPPNPTKLTDSRSDSYLARFGNESWELDALEPSVLDALITDRIAEFVDQDAMDDAVTRDVQSRLQLQRISGRWSEVVEMLG